jgi:hypothetical protein
MNQTASELKVVIILRFNMIHSTFDLVKSLDRCSWSSYPFLMRINVTHKPSNSVVMFNKQSSPDRIVVCQRLAKTNCFSHNKLSEISDPILITQNNFTYMGPGSTIMTAVVLLPCEWPQKFVRKPRCEVKCRVKIGATPSRE